MERFTEVVGADEYKCTNDVYAMTETPRELVAIEPDAPIMWLDKLIQGNSHMQVGSLEQVSMRERAPVEYIDRFAAS